ncbi:MAG: pyridoxamine 5'-phosphate oxidase family protein, partial [Acidimicrobiales bacterium]
GPKVTVRRRPQHAGPKSLVAAARVADTARMQHHGHEVAQSNGFTNLDERGCLALLDSERIGHLGLTAGALPVVTPIRYRLVGRSVVFASEDGAKLKSARRNAVACVEIAGTDEATGTDWTVLATGRLREITDPSTVSPDGGASLPPWGLATADHLCALDIELLSGSRSKVR